MAKYIKDADSLMDLFDNVSRAESEVEMAEARVERQAKAQRKALASPQLRYVDPDTYRKMVRVLMCDPIYRVSIINPGCGNARIVADVEVTSRRFHELIHESGQVVVAVDVNTARARFTLIPGGAGVGDVVVDGAGFEARSRFMI